jgi:CHAT domain-containing protein/Tfp pilus assembly protein PilF
LLAGIQGEEQAMRLTLGWLGVLMLLAAGAKGASGQPVPAPADKAAEPVPEQHNLIAKAQALATEGERHYKRGDFRSAIALLQQALAIRRQAYPRESYPSGHPELAKNIGNLGFLYQQTGEHAKAEALYREALAMQRALYPKQRYPDGHPDLAQSLNDLGFLHWGAGEYARAETLFREGLAMRRALYPRARFPDGHRDLAASINNLGLVHRDAGEDAKAEPLFREALAMYRALYPKERFPDGHPDLARGLNNLGVLHWAAGDYAKAEPLFRQALAMRQKLYPKERFPAGHPDLATSLNSLGGLHEAGGERAKAEPLFREALAMRRALYPKERFPHGHPDLAQSINNLGSFYQRTGEHAKAEPLYREALAMHRALYPPDRFPHGHPQLAITINNLATLHERAGAYARAEPLYLEALAMYRALYPPKRFPDGHPHLAGSINNLGLLHQEAGDYAKAEPLLREALGMKRALYSRARFPDGHADLAVSINNLGSLHLDAGEHAQAEPLLAEAVAMYGQLLRQFADLAAEAESRNLASTLPLTRDSLLSNSRHLAQGGAVYEALWHGRAVLTRLQERRHRDLLASSDPATVTLADELQRTRRSLARLLLRPGRDADSHRQLIDKLTQAKEELEKRIAAKLHLASVQPTTTAKQLSDALPARAAFVDLLRYVSFEQDAKVLGRKGEKRTASYVAFVVGKDQPVARVELHEAAPIEAAWAAWHKAIVAADGDPKTERAAARAFAKRVWEPIRAALPADCHTVYLTPDGTLAQVPWAALPGTRLDSVLLDEHALCLVPHGPWLVEQLQAKPARGGGDTLLAYGGIDYQGTPAAVAKGRGPRDLELVGKMAVPVHAGTRLRWAALPGTAREQAQVVALARTALKEPPIVRSGRAASTEQLLEDLPRARYAHLATHGFFADAQFRSYLQVDPKLYAQRGLGELRAPAARSPLVLSGLVLAGANRQGEEAAPDRGIITAEGLIGLRLEGLELAVLSACETGLGESGGGEGVFGLQRAFHIAGCKNVIASLWQVDDEATAALMGLLYHQLWVEKRPPLEALRQAQLTLYRHPERIGTLARARGPDFEKAARLPATPQAAGRAPTRLWAGFILSGMGH